MADDVAFDQALDRTLARVNAIAKRGAAARFKFHLPDLDAIQARYLALVFKHDSIHSSKGKEADYVIIVGLGKASMDCLLRLWRIPGATRPWKKRSKESRRCASLHA